MAIDLSLYKYSPLYSDKDWGAKNNNGLNAIQNELNNLSVNKADNSAHTALLTTVQGMQDELDDKADQASTQAALDALEAGKAPLVHSHDGQDPSTMAVMVGDTDSRPDTGTLIYFNTEAEAVELIENGAVTGVLNPEALTPLGENLLINGGFDVWQEGPGPFAPGSTSGVPVYGPDMWRGIWSGAGRVGSISRGGGASGVSTDPGLKYFADFQGYIPSGAAGDFALFEAPIEGVRTLEDQWATLSFWAKGSEAGSIHAGLKQVTGADGAAPITAQPGAQLVNLTTGWTFHSLLFTALGLENVAIGPGPDLILADFITHAGDEAAALWGQAAGWSYTGTVSLAQVKLERGSTATPFRPRPAGEELRRCQRYFRKSYPPDTLPGNATSAGQIRNQHALPSAPASNNVTMSINLPEPMRASPTVTVYTTGGVAGKVLVYTTEVTPAISDVSPRGFTLSASLTPGGSYSDVHFHYVLDARL